MHHQVTVKDKQGGVCVCVCEVKERLDLKDVMSQRLVHTFTSSYSHILETFIFVSRSEDV